MKTDLPPVICNYLCHKALAGRRPAYMRLDRRGTVLTADGDLANYRAKPLQTGEPVSAVFDFMEGLLPLDDDACHLACLQSQAGGCIDAHIIPEAQGYWLLLLDTSEEERRRQEMQQKANELALLREAQARHLSDTAGAAAGEGILAPPFEPAGARQDITIVTVGLRGVDAAEFAAAPAAYLGQLDFLRRRLAAHFKAQSGVIYRQSGDLMVVFFGFMPAETAKEKQALGAVLPVLHYARSETPGADLQPALGVASGPIIVGLDPTSGASRLHAVGAPLRVADALQRQAAPGQVLIDRSTFKNAGTLQNRFYRLSADEAPGENRVYAHPRKTTT